MLRSAYPHMLETAKNILLDGCSKNVEKDLMPVSTLVNLLPGG